MLYIRLGEFTEDCITNVNGYFNLFKKREWFNDKFVREVIKGVDNSEVVVGEYIESPIFGGMAPERLSSGAKALILMKMLPDKVVYATRCGDNCIPYLLELSETQDVTVMLHHCPKFPETGFRTVIVETGTEVHSAKEFIKEFYKYRNKSLGGV